MPTPKKREDEEEPLEPPELIPDEVPSGARKVGPGMWERQVPNPPQDPVVLHSEGQEEARPATLEDALEAARARRALGHPAPTARGYAPPPAPEPGGGNRSRPARSDPLAPPRAPRADAGEGGGGVGLAGMLSSIAQGVGKTATGALPTSQPAAPGGYTLFGLSPEQFKTMGLSQDDFDALASVPSAARGGGTPAPTPSAPPPAARSIAPVAPQPSTGAPPGPPGAPPARSAPPGPAPGPSEPYPDFSKPPPGPPQAPQSPLDELKAAQLRANRGKALDRVQEALYSVFSGRPLDSGYFARGENEQSGPVADLMQRQTFQQHDAARQMQLAQMDPASTVSARMREAIGAAAPAFRQQFTDEQWNRLSADQLTKLGKPMETVLSKAMERENQGAAEDRRNADEAKRQQDADKRRQAFEEKQRKEREKFEAEQRALDRASHERAAKEGARAQALDYKKQQNSVFGFVDEDPENPKALLPEQAQQLGQSRASRDKIMEQLSELERLHAANPHPLPNSNELRDMQAIVAELKGPMVSLNNYNLTQGHQELTEHMIGDPGQISNWLNSGALETQINRLRKTANDAVRLNAHALGKREVTPTEAPAAPQITKTVYGGAASSGPAQGRIRVTNGQKTLDILASDLARAEAKGYRRVGA